jgi:hypothetical protein
MAPRPAAAAALMDELVEEILLRIPPDDPARLLRAALVCKRWCRIVSDPGFRRRFCEFHRKPPMLGFVCTAGPWCTSGPFTSFVSTTSFRSSPSRLDYRAVDARHGRVLLHGEIWNHKRKHWDDSLVVWDPITGVERARLTLPPRSRHQEANYSSGIWNVAVLCASAAVDDACDHLDCHSGPFLVVFLARGRSGMCTQVYSSEAAAWSHRIYAPRLSEHIQWVPSALAGNSMYFLCSKSVLKFDLTTREMSLIDLPQETFSSAMLRTTEDAVLGLANMCSDGLHLWSMEVGPNEVVGWAQSKVIKLTELPPGDPIDSLSLTGFAHGLDVILVCTLEGIFTIDLKSVRVTKVCQDSSLACFTFPYMSFYTPGN